jgi:tetratricopeptide (TPR) repeat protein
MPKPVPVAARYAGYDAARMMADSDREIAGLKTRIASPNGDVFDYESLSIAYVGRSRLSGDFADLAAAQTAADDGFTKSPPGMGPWLAKAAAAYSAHRFDVAAAALDKVDRFVVPDSITRAEAKAIRADLALTNGRLDDASRLLGEAEAIDRWPGLYARRAQLAFARGDFETAKREFRASDAANRDPSPQARADSLIWQGDVALAQGDWDSARTQYQAATSAFPGYHKARLKQAQVQALTGDRAGALKAFEALAQWTGQAEPMDRAAALYRIAGDGISARRWAARSAAVWQSRLALLPEAAWGHAAEHELAFGNPKRALDLAGRNARNRPAGESLVLLAKAWLANGRADHANALTAKAAAQGFRSVDLWMTRADALSLLGRGDEADAARDKAVAINPKAASRNPALIWFDH